MAKTFSKSDGRPSHQEIAQRAYELFEKSGGLPGRDMQNWLEAERQLVAAAQQRTVTPQAITTPSNPSKSAPRQERVTRA